MRIDIIGAGAWGTSLAIHACRNTKHQVSLWAQHLSDVQAIKQLNKNQKYLPDIELPTSLNINWLDQPQCFEQIASHTELLILATPMSALRSMLQQLTETEQSTQYVAWLCKGFEQSINAKQHGLMAHEIQQSIAPKLITGVFSGPTFAQEVALDKPCAIVAASQHIAMRQQLINAFHHGNMRVYQSTDITGVEVGGAVKNVLAIAVGLCDGLQLGYNARAALITRGLAEMTRLGIALGANLDTFMGLSGLGDLVLTATGDLSRNRQVGQLLAQGQSLQQAVSSLGHVAEGVYSAKTVVQRARMLGIEMPVAELVVQLVENKVSATQAINLLMQRTSKYENQTP